jgi:hypothetical protein
MRADGVNIADGVKMIINWYPNAFGYRYIRSFNLPV